MNKDKRREIFSRLQAADPAPTTELHYDTPFELLIAVILSAQATDISVNKATDTLYPVARTPQALLDLGLAGLKRHIRHIGLYNSKAENILKTCRLLLERHQGEVPTWTFVGAFQISDINDVIADLDENTGQHRMRNL